MPGPPLKQYELTLQNAQRVLISLLEQPAKPWVPFDALLHELGQQLALLRRRSAACQLQRGLRAARARRAEGQTWRGSDQRKVPTRKAGGYEDSPKKVLIPVPPAIQAPGGPLNPLEKRRQMVAAQLAISNPARLARSRRCRPDPPPLRESQGGTQEEPIVALPKLQPLVACTVGRKARGDVTELAAAPLELLLKEVKEEPDDRPDEVDQLGLLGQCDSAGISMAPPPAFGAWPRPSSAKAPRRSPLPCAAPSPCDGKAWPEGRPTPPSTAHTTAEFYSTASSFTVDAFEAPRG